MRGDRIPIGIGVVTEYTRGCHIEYRVLQRAVAVIDSHRRTVLGIDDIDTEVQIRAHIDAEGGDDVGSAQGRHGVTDGVGADGRIAGPISNLPVSDMGDHRPGSHSQRQEGANHQRLRQQPISPQAAHCQRGKGQSQEQTTEETECGNQCRAADHHRQPVGGAVDRVQHINGSAGALGADADPDLRLDAGQQGTGDGQLDHVGGGASPQGQAVVQAHRVVGRQRAARREATGHARRQGSGSDDGR